MVDLRIGVRLPGCVVKPDWGFCVSPRGSASGSFLSILH